MHYNNNFIYINGRPVADVQQADISELEAQGFRRITDDYNEHAFDMIPTAAPAPQKQPAATGPDRKNGPTFV